MLSSQYVGNKMQLMNCCVVFKGKIGRKYFKILINIFIRKLRSQN